jgi:hypothetical protein
MVLDVANESTVECLDSAFKEIKGHVANVHLSDTDYKTWTHSPDGVGKLEFYL